MSVTNVDTDAIRFQTYGDPAGGPYPGGTWRMDGGVVGDASGTFIEAIMRVSADRAAGLVFSVERVSMVSNQNASGLCLLYPGHALASGSNVILSEYITKIATTEGYLSNLGQDWYGVSQDVNGMPFSPDAGNDWQLDTVLNTNGVGFRLECTAEGYWWEKATVQRFGLLRP